ncbi:hypothetical protein [Peribacillus asahii]|uniref:hypothetical protein n=1 Tax=Peribacillus asahii TaxID=228899 RepID=UPI0037FFF1F3
MITIHKPEIKKIDKSVQLQAVIKIGEKEDTLWFEVENKYGEFLTDERADAFVVGLLWKALEYGYDIHVLSPMSERLYYTVNTFLIPIISQIHNYKKINVICEQLASKPISNTGAVGTGLSCGIDSFSTIYEHLKSDKPKNYQITHLTFFNNGSHGPHGKEKTRSLFEQRINISRACASDIGKELIIVNSNISKIVSLNFQATHTLRNMSAVLALQKLFNVYYYSSTYHLKDFKFSTKDSAFYDIFNLSMISTESVSLFSSCTNLTRVEKTRLVSNFEPAHKYLNVCTRAGSNCGKCNKCLRTLLTLEIIGALEKFETVFDLNLYYQNRSKFIKKVKTEHKFDIFLKEIYDEMVRMNI